MNIIPANAVEVLSLFAFMDFKMLHIHAEEC